ncbi:MAG: MarR family transcriptional regulator [Pseudobutyrivibrio sp.]|nr:MarR family transcriptional regulator [Pseudobutyrivibrio sp.]
MEQFVEIGRNMTIIVKQFKAYLKSELSQYGLNAAEGMVLMMMYHKTSHNEGTDNNCGSTQDEIIKEIHYDKGVMTRTMKVLEEQGYVIRDNNPSDMRSFLFYLTAKGMEFKPVMMDILARWNQKMTFEIEPDNLSVSDEVLNKMVINVSNIRN